MTGGKIKAFVRQKQHAELGGSGLGLHGNPEVDGGLDHGVERMCNQMGERGFYQSSESEKRVNITCSGRYKWWRINRLICQEVIFGVLSSCECRIFWQERCSCDPSRVIELLIHYSALHFRLDRIYFLSVLIINKQTHHLFTNQCLHHVCFFLMSHNSTSQCFIPLTLHWLASLFHCLCITQPFILL